MSNSSPNDGGNQAAFEREIWGAFLQEGQWQSRYFRENSPKIGPRQTRHPTRRETGRLTCCRVVRLQGFWTDCWCIITSKWRTGREGRSRTRLHQLILTTNNTPIQEGDQIDWGFHWRGHTYHTSRSCQKSWTITRERQVKSHEGDWFVRWIVWFGLHTYYLKWRQLPDRRWTQ